MAGQLQILMPDSRRTAGLSSDSAAFQQDHFFGACLRGLDFLFLLCSNLRMTDRPASWRMPTPKQMEKLAAEATPGGRRPPLRLRMRPSPPSIGIRCSKTLAPRPT